MLSKKIAGFMALLLMTACLGGCSGSSEAESVPANVSAEVSEISEETEKLTETEEISETEETTIETTVEETTAEETTTEETTNAKVQSPWTVKNYLDEFDRPIEDAKYLQAFFEGTFSNSATSNSELTVSMTVSRDAINDNDYDCVDIKLFEYDSHKVTNYYSKTKYYTVMILEENENVINTEGSMFSKGDAIFFMEDHNKNDLINAMKNNNTLIFKITEDDGMGKYLFTVDCTGFADMFDSLEINYY